MSDARTTAAGANGASSDAAEPDDDTPIRMFGDPRSEFVQRGPDRRRTVAAPTPVPVEHHEEHVIRLEAEHLPPHRGDSARALRIGRGDAIATILNVAGFLLFGATLVMSAIIFSNAKNVGAFSDPWNSNRVAIGFAVLALGLIDSALLIGVARVISYQLATLRLKLRALEHEQHSIG